jgi:hypothetical protein
MKKNLQIMMMFAAFGVFFGCALTGYAQKKPIILGGYKTVAVTDAGVEEAAEFAVSQHSQNNEASLEIVSIRKAERQIVQGLNYRMCVEVKVAEEDNDETQFVLAVVYRNLKKEFKLVSWKPDACGVKE